MKPYIEKPKEVVVNFMLSLNKAIANYRDVEDGGAQYSSTTCSSESTAGTSKCSANHFHTAEHSLPSANNIIELEGPLHESISTHLTEVIQVGDPRARDTRMKEAIAAEIRDPARRSTFKIVMRTKIPPNANVLTA